MQFFFILALFETPLNPSPPPSLWGIICLFYAFSIGLYEMQFILNMGLTLPPPWTQKNCPWILKLLFNERWPTTGIYLDPMMEKNWRSPEFRPGLDLKIFLRIEEPVVADHLPDLPHHKVARSHQHWQWGLWVVEAIEEHLWGRDLFNTYLLVTFVQDNLAWSTPL